MNYIDYVKSMHEDVNAPEGLSFMISGNDPFVHSLGQRYVFGTLTSGKDLVIIDNTVPGVSEADMQRLGYEVRNGLSGEYGLYNPLCIRTFQNKSVLSGFLSCLAYDERQKAMILGWLELIADLEEKITDQRIYTITYEQLKKYNSYQKMECCLKELEHSRRITGFEHEVFLQLYQEYAAVSAHFENDMRYLHAFMEERRIITSSAGKKALLFRTKEVDIDNMNQWWALSKLLKLCLEHYEQRQYCIVIIDRNSGKQQFIAKLLKEFDADETIHLFTDDVFTINDGNDLSNLLKRFSVKVYGKHDSMESCRKIEEHCGTIRISRTTTSIAHDDHFRANSVWDQLLGRDQIRTQTSLAPADEPRYRKEDIHSFSNGTCIVEANGTFTLI